MWSHSDLTATEILQKIRSRKIVLGGNVKLKIFGKLTCKSGKRIKKENRILFHSRDEALGMGYRPCGHCMPDDYKKWKEKYGLI